MDTDLKVLLEKQESIKLQILNLETKNFFVIAFRKTMKSKEFIRYMELKKDLKDNSKDKIITVNKIIKLESYGSVSDYLYLLNNCKDVNLYIKLRIKMFEIERQINNFNFKEEAQNENDIEIINKYLENSYLEKKAKTLIK